MTPTVQMCTREFAETIKDKAQAEMFRRFSTCADLRASGSGQPPIDADSIDRSTYSFLGYYMIKDFDVLGFLEDIGEWAPEPLGDDDDEDAWEGDNEDCQEVQAQNSTRVYELAAVTVRSFLKLLIKRGTMTEQQLQGALAKAEAARKDLPACAILGEFLPGPLNSCIGMALGDAFPLDTARDVAYTAASVERRFRPSPQLCQDFDFKAALSSVAGDKKPKAVRSEHKRMHVAEVQGGKRVRFTTCLQGSTAWAEPAEGVWIEFDAPTAALLRPGLIVTASFIELSDGRWCLSDPGYVWPSFYCVDERCPGRFQAAAASAGTEPQAAEAAAEGEGAPDTEKSAAAAVAADGPADEGENDGGKANGVDAASAVQ